MVCCPVCGEKTHIQPGLPIGKFVDCKWCGSELEIVSREPYTLVEAPEIEDAWGE